MMSLRADIPDRVITGTDLAVRTEAPSTCCLNFLHMKGSQSEDSYLKEGAKTACFRYMMS